MQGVPSEAPDSREAADGSKPAFLNQAAFHPSLDVVPVFPELKVSERVVGVRRGLGRNHDVHNQTLSTYEV